MEHWTDKAVDSVKGMQRASPPEDAFSKIQGRISATELRAVPEKRPSMMAIAAAIALLISCNLYVVVDYFSSNNTQAEMELQYEGLLSDFNLYSE
ncbi:hypothetical protein [Algoriphagus chordae]|uniref:Uncharacterized protein n=1 Tax=Algoriphagus chordae TaxID=237019 RepID=A0A2W7RIN2_9BACT|nr:hypothetical protein [Algoriphagus chordae]PZX50615.1 hypothetical protein LV85_02722 [Algoriphagus chordae]